MSYASHHGEEDHDSLDGPTFRSIATAPPASIYSAPSKATISSSLLQFPKPTPVRSCDDDDDFMSGAFPSSDPSAFSLLADPITRSGDSGFLFPGDDDLHSAAVMPDLTPLTLNSFGEYRTKELHASAFSLLQSAPLKSSKTLSGFPDATPVPMHFSGSFLSEPFSPDFSFPDSDFSSLDVPSLSSKKAPAAGSFGGDMGLHGIFQAQESQERADQYQNAEVTALRRDMLDVLPVFIERYTSFVSVTEPSDILKSLFAAFQHVNADVRYNAAKQRVKGVVYPSDRACVFKVKLYRGARKDETCVEFQRRSGDSIAFCQFYRSTIVQLRDLNPHPFVSGCKAARVSFVNKPCIDMPTIELEDSTVKALFEMASNENHNIQSEGVQVLACVSGNPKHSEQLLAYMPEHAKAGAQGSLVGLLKGLLQVEDTIVLRSAGLLLRNCMKNPKNMDCTSKTCLGCQVAQCGLVSALVSLFDCPVSLGLKDVQRQLGCALAQLVVTHPNCIKKSDQKAKLVSTLKRICGENGRCRILKASLQATLSAVTAL
eukprot:gb/GEZN01002386.1/.p1 GENE.gb/GEZN01002386.1/~~gb/GEZN01002386.1/.p1  ORF type:complete len:543 (+),score=55.82 gb/GEZN01002386.1/:382-2010(+)